MNVFFPLTERVEGPRNKNRIIVCSFVILMYFQLINTLQHFCNRLHLLGKFYLHKNKLSHAKGVGSPANPSRIGLQQGSKLHTQKFHLSGGQVVQRSNCPNIFTQWPDIGPVEVILWHLSLGQVAGGFTCPPAIFTCPGQEYNVFFRTLATTSQSFSSKVD